MTEQPKKFMVLSQRPNGQILITACEAKKEDLGDNVDTVFRCCSDAVATECVPQTQAAIDDFAARHSGRLIYPNLARYPRPIGD